MGLVSLAMSVAPALGPAVSGIVLQFLSWRWIFLVVLPIAVAIAVIGSKRLGNVGETQSTPIDWLSAALSAVGFGALVYGLSQMSHATASVIVLVVVGLRTLRTRVFSVSLAAMAIAFGAMIGSMLLLQLYLQHARHMSPLSTGLLVMPGGLAMGLLGPTIGRIYDRSGARVLMIPGGVLVVFALAVFALMDTTTPYWMVLVAHVALSLGLGALFTPMFTMSLGSLSSHLYSHGSSLLGATQQVAGALGTALVVVVLTSQAGASAAQGLGATAAYLNGLHWAFGLCAAAAVAMVGLVATLPARIAVEQSEPVAAHV